MKCVASAWRDGVDRWIWLLNSAADRKMQVANDAVTYEQSDGLYTYRMAVENPQIGIFMWCPPEPFLILHIG